MLQDSTIEKAPKPLVQLRRRHRSAVNAAKPFHETGFALRIPILEVLVVLEVPSELRAELQDHHR